jgi:polyhydroxybutyrate depolymerase
MRILLLSAVLLPFLSACGLERFRHTEPTDAPAPTVGPYPAGGSHASIEVGGRHRTFHVFIPPTLDSAHPAALIVQLHGGRGSGASIDSLTRLNAVAEREGFITAAPDGVDGNWNDGRPDVDNTAANDNIDDVGFLVAMIDEVSSRNNVDRHRVFAMGISNGAMMANRLACERPDRFAAVALVAGTGPAQLGATCASDEPVSVISVHGTADPLVPYNGGVGKFSQVGSVATVDATAAYWASRDKCDSPPATAEVSPTVSSRVWRCPAASVAFYRVEGGGHTWPGGPQYLSKRIVGATDRSIDATDLIWNFFYNAVA